MLGQSFTPAGLAAVSGARPGDARARLRASSGASCCAEDLDPRSPERGQYAFVQALIREVAYAHAGAKDRRSRHLAAARFFESLGDDELAGALAAHYLAAYRADADRRRGRRPRDPGAARPPRRGRAGRRARAPDQAVAFLEQALEVTSRPGGARRRSSSGPVEAAALATHFDRALEPSSPQVTREESGDRPGLALAMAMEAEAADFTPAQRERSGQLSPEAVDRFEDLGDHPAMLRARWATWRMRRRSTRQYDVALAMS